jgi:hypothetical protein
MKLTPEDYRRGLLKWNPQSSAEVHTFATDDPDAPTIWSDPHTDPSGSLVTSAAGVQVQLSIRRTGEGELPFPIRWDRLAQGEIVQAIVFDPEPHNGQYIKLAHISNYGTFHRLVVEATPTLAWEHDAVLRVKDAMVRLVTGTITGEQVSPIEDAEVQPDGLTLTSGQSGTVRREGRFIEIVAPGENASTAELNASSILGLLAIVFGASAVGDVAFSEPYTAIPREPQRGHYRIPVTRQLPSAVEEAGLATVDEILGTLLEDEPMPRAVRLALHWFERGIRSRTPLDELLSSFVGIESILNTFASVNGPIPEVEERKGLGPRIRDLLAGEVDDAVIARLRNSLAHASVRDRFSFYVSLRELDHPAVARFGELVDVRNRAFHGEPASATPDHAATASRLLIAMLRKELDLNVQLPWDAWPLISHMELHWALACCGFHG